MAEDSTEETVDEELEEEGGSMFSKILVLLGLAAIGSFLLKKKREQELDEALWEEPQAL